MYNLQSRRQTDGRRRETEKEREERQREREGCGLIQAWNIIRLETTARTKGREPVKSVIKQAKAKVTSQLSERRDRYIHEYNIKSTVIYPGICLKFPLTSL